MDWPNFLFDCLNNLNSKTSFWDKASYLMVTGFVNIAITGARNIVSGGSMPPGIQSPEGVPNRYTPKPRTPITVDPTKEPNEVGAEDVDPRSDYAPTGATGPERNVSSDDAQVKNPSRNYPSTGYSKNFE